MAKHEFDYVLVGGGLQNGLLTLALCSARPSSRIALVEQAERLGGNHTWCFHAADLPRGAADWIEPLIVHRWPGYRILFPNLTRHIGGGYSAITSGRFHDVISSRFERAGSELLLGQRATRVDAHEVILESGRALSAGLVVDARGPEPDSRAGDLAGYQKFLGLEVTLESPHGMDLPVLMDATVDQSHGFRFYYVLPLATDRVLVEDTYFHQSPDLDRESLRRGIHAYCESKGFQVANVVREESGVLPMPWAGSLAQARTDPIKGGYSGGWYHPGTGYSFPVAVRLAAFLAEQRSGELSTDRFARMVRNHNTLAKYCHLLNGFLFRWYPPHQRWHIFERFYRMPEDTIGRFYALRMTVMDRLRLLGGKPPSGLSPAYRLRGRSAQ